MNLSRTTYPEHDKMRVVAEESRAIGQFLEWLRCEGWRIEKHTEIEGDDGVEYEAIGYMPEEPTDLLAEFYGIDLVAIEREKRAMLKELRS